MALVREGSLKTSWEIPFDPPPNEINLLNFGKPRSRLKPQINVAFGSITYATISSGLSSWWESTVCGYAVSGTLYANVIPASSGTLSIDTCQSFIDTS
jgi:hypothetical protein